MKTLKFIYLEILLIFKFALIVVKRLVPVLAITFGLLGTIFLVTIAIMITSILLPILLPIVATLKHLNIKICFVGFKKFINKN
jgi:hypothetical protein